MVTRVDDDNTAAAADGKTVSNSATVVAGATSDVSNRAVIASVSAQGAATAAAASIAEAVVPAAVSNEEGGSASAEKVCRFLITNLQGKRGYAKNDYRIDLLHSKHGLYNIAETVFDIMDKEKLTTDFIYSHLWNMTFSKNVYKNGWRRQRRPGSDEWNRPATITDIDEGEPRLFSGLDVPLEKGQKGKFSGESASFDYVLESIVDMSAASDKAAVAYPHVSKVANKISAKLEDDWLTPSRKSQCNKHRDMWRKFYSGKNSWKQLQRGDRAFTRAKPIAPMWGEELKIMGLLINADCKFKKSWTNIMQYAFVDRTESACSMRWYQLKKEDYRLEWYGKGKSASEKIVLAKRLAKSMMKDQLERKPKRERHPYANSKERWLREYAERDLAYENGY